MACLTLMFSFRMPNFTDFRIHYQVYPHPALPSRVHPSMFIPTFFHLTMEFRGIPFSLGIEGNLKPKPQKLRECLRFQKKKTQQKNKKKQKKQKNGKQLIIYPNPLKYTSKIMVLGHFPPRLKKKNLSHQGPTSPEPIPLACSCAKSSSSPEKSSVRRWLAANISEVTQEKCIKSLWTVHCFTTFFGQIWNITNDTRPIKSV